MVKHFACITCKWNKFIHTNQSGSSWSHSKGFLFPAFQLNTFRMENLYFQSEKSMGSPAAKKEEAIERETKWDADDEKTNCICSPIIFCSLLSRKKRASNPFGRRLLALLSSFIPIIIIIFIRLRKHSLCLPFPPLLNPLDHFRANGTIWSPPPMKKDNWCKSSKSQSGKVPWMGNCWIANGCSLLKTWLSFDGKWVSE